MKGGGCSLSNCQWTNEMHVHFLNTMEASFVESMFENKGYCLPRRLDRYLPDTSESTEDLIKERRRRRRITCDTKWSRARTDKKIRIVKSKQDQAVPSLENKRFDKDKDEKDHLDVQ